MVDYSLEQWSPAKVSRSLESVSFDPTQSQLQSAAHVVYVQSHSEVVVWDTEQHRLKITYFRHFSSLCVGALMGEGCKGVKLRTSNTPDFMSDCGFGECLSHT